ncbi:ParB/Srx family N-terminal domain-containing protein [Elstera cyanobacteriorum]|uniref:ParB/Srx family N-terminal domain-containing protein n=1 Tax=Elstera cyanobacteriorum TaxID=2022747 RepID=UPI002351F7D6|nr:ParB/Srx family N-terminal domain-containing protein [Elstera cyanobacteriorum]MCK6419257.1 ParB/RepB/Spo0J family partition protein [Alphaproteobacteria bacterium]MCK6442010.1 ParB/RepB/Spo0J family partition protein [Elstera cyanobacteriorum]
MISARKNEIYNFENEYYYDIFKLSNFINENYDKIIIRKAPIDQNLLYHISSYKELDEDWVKDMPITRAEEPILVAELPNGQFRVIDGHHRINRLHRSGCTEISVISIPKEIIASFIMQKEVG